MKLILILITSFLIGFSYSSMKRNAANQKIIIAKQKTIDSLLIIKAPCKQ